MATLVYLTGFEHGLATLSANGGGLVNTISGSPSVQGTTKRTGGYALKCTPAGASVYIARTISTNILVGSVYVYFGTLPDGDTYLVAGYASGSAYPIVYYRQSTNKIVIGYNGVSGQNESTQTMATGQWYRIDYRFDTSSGTHTIDCQVDGTALTQRTNTATTFTMTARRMGAIGAVNGDVYFDDVNESVTSGDYPIGAHAVEGSRPDSDGTHNAGTNVIEDTDGNDIGAVTAYDHLSKDPFSSTLGEYIKQVATGTGNYAEVNFADTTQSTIIGAMALLQYRAAGTGTDEGGCIIIDEDTTETTVWGNPTTRADYSESSMFYKSVILPTPAGGWDATAVNALKARIGYSNDVADVPYWNALIVEVAYGPSGDMSVNKSESVTVGEIVTVEITSSEVNKSEAVTVGEAVTAALITEISKSETVTVADAPTVEPLGIGGSAAEAVQVGESVSASLSDALSINTSDGVEVTDAPAASLPELETRAVNVSETIGLGETVTASLDPLVVSVMDGITVTDTPTVSLVEAGAYTISVSDGVTVGESVTVEIASLSFATTEEITVSDTPTVSEEAAVQDLAIAITPDSVFAVGVRIYP